MELLQDKIKNLLAEAKNLKSKEAELVNDIKDAYKQNYNLDHLKKALLYVTETNPKNNWGEYVWLTLGKSWKSEDPIYHFNFKFHENYGNTPPTYVFDLKDIRYFCAQKDLYLTLFVKHLSSRNIKFTSLKDFTDMINMKSPIEILNLLWEELFADTMCLVNHSALKVKNVVVVLPKMDY